MVLKGWGKFENELLDNVGFRDLIPTYKIYKIKLPSLDNFATKQSYKRVTA